MIQYNNQSTQTIADRLWEVEGLINSVYAGRNIKVLAVDPFSFHSKAIDGGGYTQLDPFATNVYVGGLVWNTTDDIMTISVLNVDIILPENMSGQRILFDHAVCTAQSDAATKPFQFTGWKSTIDGAYDAVPDIAASAGLEYVEPLGGALMAFEPQVAAMANGGSSQINDQLANPQLLVLYWVEFSMQAQCRLLVSYTSGSVTYPFLATPGKNQGSFGVGSVDPTLSNLQGIVLQVQNPADNNWIDYLTYSIGQSPGFGANAGQGAFVNSDDFDYTVLAASVQENYYVPTSYFAGAVTAGNLIGVLEIDYGVNSIILQSDVDITPPFTDISFLQTALINTTKLIDDFTPPAMQLTANLTGKSGKSIMVAFNWDIAAVNGWTAVSSLTVMPLYFGGRTTAFKSMSPVP